MSTLTSAKMRNLRDKLDEQVEKEIEEEAKEELAKVGKNQKTLKVKREE